LVAFMAAMYLRTPAMRDHMAEQLDRAVAMMDEGSRWAKTATPDQLAAASSPLRPDAGTSITYGELKDAASHPLQTVLLPQVANLTQMLLQLDMAVLTACERSRFITSDFPCVWFDPEAYKRPPFYRSPGLGHPAIEVTFPISPGQMLLLNRKGVRGTISVEDDLVDEYNRRTCLHCAKSFVNFENQTKASWFDPGVMPADSWENTRKHERPAVLAKNRLRRRLKVWVEKLKHLVDR